LDLRVGVVRADPDGHAIPADAETEADRLFSNLEAILDAGGAALTDVVRVSIVICGRHVSTGEFWDGDLDLDAAAARLRDLATHPR
jgi:enamine deaminase RidA (YjgF/YER057c/UK114 family)